MITNAPIETSSWRLVRFPSSIQRKEFLDQVRLWNSVDGLPPIEFKLTSDEEGLRIFTADPSQKNVLRLIDAFGGNPFDVT